MVVHVEVTDENGIQVHVHDDIVGQKYVEWLEPDEAVAVAEKLLRATAEVAGRAIEDAHVREQGPNPRWVCASCKNNVRSKSLPVEWRMAILDPELPSWAPVCGECDIDKTWKRKGKE